MAGQEKRKEYCEILGVDEEASQEDIKKAYKQLALRCHPDKNQLNPEATKEFQRISEAYTNLCQGDDSEEDFDGGGISVFDLLSMFFLRQRRSTSFMRPSSWFSRCSEDSDSEVVDSDDPCTSNRQNYWNCSGEPTWNEDWQVPGNTRQTGKTKKKKNRKKNAPSARNTSTATASRHGSSANTSTSAGAGMPGGDKCRTGADVIIDDTPLKQTGQTTEATDANQLPGQEGVMDPNAKHESASDPKTDGITNESAGDADRRGSNGSIRGLSQNTQSQTTDKKPNRKKLQAEQWKREKECKEIHKELLEKNRREEEKRKQKEEKEKSKQEMRSTAKPNSLSADQEKTFANDRSPEAKQSFAEHQKHSEIVTEANNKMEESCSDSASLNLDKRFENKLNSLSSQEPSLETMESANLNGIHDVGQSSLGDKHSAEEPDKSACTDNPSRNERPTFSRIFYGHIGNSERGNRYNYNFRYPDGRNSSRFRGQNSMRGFRYKGHMNNPGFRPQQDFSGFMEHSSHSSSECGSQINQRGYPRDPGFESRSGGGCNKGGVIQDPGVGKYKGATMPSQGLKSSIRCPSQASNSHLGVECTDGMDNSFKQENSEIVDDLKDISFRNSSVLGHSNAGSSLYQNQHFTNSYDDQGSAHDASKPEKDATNQEARTSGFLQKHGYNSKRRSDCSGNGGCSGGFDNSRNSHYQNQNHGRTHPNQSQKRLISDASESGECSSRDNGIQNSGLAKEHQIPDMVNTRFQGTKPVRGGFQKDGRGRGRGRGFRQARERSHDGKQCNGFWQPPRSKTIGQNNFSEQPYNGSTLEFYRSKPTHEGGEGRSASHPMQNQRNSMTPSDISTRWLNHSVGSHPDVMPQMNVWKDRQEFYEGALPKSKEEEDEMLEAALKLSKLDVEEKQLEDEIEQVSKSAFKLPDSVSCNEVLLPPESVCSSTTQASHGDSVGKVSQLTGPIAFRAEQSKSWADEMEELTDPSGADYSASVCSSFQSSSFPSHNCSTNQSLPTSGVVHNQPTDLGLSRVFLPETTSNDTSIASSLASGVSNQPVCLADDKKSFRQNSCLVLDDDLRDSSLSGGFISTSKGNVSRLNFPVISSLSVMPTSSSVTRLVKKLDTCSEETENEQKTTGQSSMLEDIDDGSDEEENCDVLDQQTLNLRTKNSFACETYPCDGVLVEGAVGFCDLEENEYDAADEDRADPHPGPPTGSNDQMPWPHTAYPPYLFPMPGYAPWYPMPYPHFWPYLPSTGPMMPVVSQSPYLSHSTGISCPVGGILPPPAPPSQPASAASPASGLPPLLPHMFPPIPFRFHPHTSHMAPPAAMQIPFPHHFAADSDEIHFAGPSSTSDSLASVKEGK